jgi:amino acid transporter
LTETKKYSTFEGVFKPTLLTILGVIMYLRTGWVVGNGGLLGGILVVVAAVSITLSTGLSLSSIATNTRLGAGGPYAMISKSLGIEIGGSVGVPLFLCQSLAVAMYIFGFREGWLTIFPNHLPIAVDLSIFLLVFTVAYISAGLAFQLQYLVMGMIGLSLISIFSSQITTLPNYAVPLWSGFPGPNQTNTVINSSFWEVFAVFFPAATGILSGVNMSGELKNSRISIPNGTLGAIGVSTVIYLGLVWWVGKAGSAGELINNYTIIIDQARWPALVLGGLLAATFSAALSSLVGAPRILIALAQDGVIPKGQWLTKLSSNREPRRCLIVSSVIVLAALLLRDLNTIAPFITMFFLITYGMINVVVLIESSLGLMNFRPTFKIPIIIPLYGALACLVAMVVINATFSLAASSLVLIIYFRLVSMPNYRRSADVRSGIFTAIAEWAATKVIQLEINSERSWKPTLIVPVVDHSQLLGEYRLLVNLTRPEGSIKLLGLADSPTQIVPLQQRIQDLSHSLRKQKIFTTSSVILSSAPYAGIVNALQTLQSAFFRPNVLFLRAVNDSSLWPDILCVFQEARRLDTGVMFFALHPQAGLGRAEVINVWIRPQLGNDPMKEKLTRGSINLAILMGLRLRRSWRGELNIISVVQEYTELEAANYFLEELKDLARIPEQATLSVMLGDFQECVGRSPQADIHLIGLQTIPDYHFVQKLMAITGSSCLFTKDSGSESALS